MKTLAVSLSLSIILACPGLIPYQALGQTLTRVSVSAPVSGRSALPVSEKGLSLSNPSSSLGRVGLAPGSSLPGLGGVLPVLESDSAQVSAGAAAAVFETYASAVAGTAGPRTAPMTAAPAAQPAVSPTETPNLAPALQPAPAQEVVTLVDKTESFTTPFKALKELFYDKEAEALPAESVAAAADAGQASNASYRLASPSQAPPEEGADSATGVPAVTTPGAQAAAPKADEAPKEGSKWLGLGKVAVFFILALIVGQIGIEALGAAMPGLIEKSFGDVTKMAEITIFASATNIIGRTVGTIAVERFGLKKTFLGATALRVLSVSGLAALLATGTMTWPLMIAFYSLNGFLGGIAMTAEFSIPPAIYGSDQVKLEKFWTWQQTLLEIVGVTAPIVTGAVVASMGFLPALVAFPVSFGAALLIMFFTLNIPKKVAAMKAAEAAGAGGKAAPKSVGAAFKEFFAKMARGAKVVWADPLLKTIFLAFTAFMILNPMLYTLMAPSFGMRLLGPAGEALYTSVIGMLTGLYSLGGLFGGFMMMAEQRRIGRLKEPAPGSGLSAISAAEERELLRKSMIRWMRWGTVGLAAIATMAFPVPMLGALVSLPAWLSWAGAMTLPAVALIPFGVAQVVSTVKLKSYFQSKAPEASMADAMGFFGSASLAASTLAILGLKFLFKGLAGFTPFVVIALAMLPLAAYYVYVTRKLDRLSAEDKR
ncbi:MAG: MFS transporter [Elusimicrobia bacterium]|nr:MFS transporter [Elusimicrobiota bacterium]